MINLDKLVRKNILNLKPYSSARDEFKGTADAFLDANENPYNKPYNRYPDPLQIQLKEKISILKKIPIENIFIGNGSDEPIDLSIRIFCEPGIDNIVAIEPTYGMYKVAAEINAVQYVPVPLTDNFELNANDLLQSCNTNTKLIFLCSPNNPTGNYLNPNEIIHVLNNFKGIVILDEAYIDFSYHQSFLTKLYQYQNLIVLQTFSKAWGLAAIRLGLAFAAKEIIQLFNKVKYPYNVNQLTIDYALKAIEENDKKNQWVKNILENRNTLVEQLKQIPVVMNIFPSDANFILVKVTNANHIYEYLTTNKIIVRNRSNVHLCSNSIRITVGTDTENQKLIEALKKYSERYYSPNR